ncbi:MAG: PGF-pre-PGF domain-containing protein, partial [Hadesarchaea archaeon]|nr:PGF-pre-PGF domain-containing protein [Hadesarchaea archaeon]
MGSELGGWAKPSLGQRAGAVAVPVLLTLLLLSPPAAITITSTQDAGAQPAENQLADNQISENHVLIETWTGVVQALAAWQLVEAWTGVILENRPLDNQITENQVADNQVVENQISISSGAITVVIGNIAAGESGTADFSACENMPLEEVTITLLENSADVSITVRTFASEPAGLPALKFAAVYAYLDISTSVQENLIESATIVFSVPKSWIHANQIDAGRVALYHYDNAWQGLTTTWTRGDNKCVYFSAQSSGFSCAIAGTRGCGKKIVVTFDRQLSGDRVGQHKVPPLSLVTMKITAEVSSQVENATLIDYFPSSWTVADAKGGIVSSYDEDYNKIEWSIGSISDSVSRSYVIRSPELTKPPIDYYFHSELTYERGSASSDEWRVKVADPTDPDTGWKSPSSYANKDAGWTEDEASNSAYSTDDGYAAQTSTNDRGCDYLNFGCNVPSGSIINGIEVSLEGHHSGGSYYPYKFS